MAKTIRTSDGDILDEICYRHYGHLLGVVEQIYEANYGLAQIKQPYPAGVVIHLPDLPPKPQPTVTLWE